MSRIPRHRALPYAEYYRRMLASAPKVTFNRTGEPVHPLANLNLEASHDMALALFSSWAVVADVLSFYRERIADEGYLNSAIEPSSILYMASTLSYQSWPGVAASTWLALTLSTTSIPTDKNRPTTIRIPAGDNLVVQNIPRQGALPVIFESLDEIEARVEWNQLKPLIPTRSNLSVVTLGMLGLRLDGAVTSLRPGSPVLLLTKTSSYFRFIETIDIQRAAGYTVILWKQGLETKPALETERITGVFVFRQQAGLFGRRAPDWNTAPDTLRSLTGTPSGGVLTLSPQAEAWQSVNGSLAAESVRALIANSSSTVFAATSSGLYAGKSPLSGTSWTSLTMTPTRQDLYSLCLDDRGFLYAGGTRGAISFSTDEGQSWQTLRAPLATVAEKSSWGVRLLRFLHIKSTPAIAPPTTPAFDGVVRAITAGPFNASRYIFTGTDQGIFRMEDAALQWEPFSEGLPAYNESSGMAGTVIHALSLDSSLKTLLAGTSAGLYTRSSKDSKWDPISLPLTSQPIVFSIAVQENVRFAGTSAGVFLSSSQGPWVAAGSGLSRNCSVRAFAVSKPAESGSKTSAFILAATDAGIFRSTDLGQSWVSLNHQQLSLFSVEDLFSDSLRKGTLPDLLRQLFAANGIALPPQDPLIDPLDSNSWKILNYLISKDGSSLNITQTMPLSSLDLQAVATDSSGRCFLAAPVGPFLESDWPNLQLTDDTVPVDRVISDLQPGSHVILQQTAPQPQVIVCKIDSAEQLPYQSYGRQATVTVLNTEGAEGRLGLLRQRDANVFLKPSPLSPYTAEKPVFTVISGDAIELAGAIDSLYKGQQIAISGPRPSAIIPSAGGVFRLPLEPSLPVPEAVPSGLPQEDICALISDGVSLWTAVGGLGVYRRAVSSQDPSQDSWTPVKDGLTNLALSCLAVSSAGICAGTNGGGLFLWTSETGWKPDPFSPVNIQTLAADSAGTIYAGTPDQGLLRRAPSSPVWTSLTKSSPPPNIRALTIGEHNVLYAATEAGVLRFDSSSVEPPLVGQPASKPLSNTSGNSEDAPDLSELDVTALSFRSGILYAGTITGGVYRLSAPTGSWEPMQPPPTIHPIRCIAFDSTENLYIGTGGSGVFRWLTDTGWAPVFTSVSNDIAALLPDAPNSILIACGDTSVLSSAARQPLRFARTHLFSAPADIAELDLETISPLLQSVFQQNGFTLTKPALHIIEPGSLWVLRDIGRNFLLRLRDAHLSTAELRVSQIPALSVISFAPTPHVDTPAPAISYTWTFASGSHTGSLTATMAELLLCPSEPKSPLCGEVVTLAAATVLPGCKATHCTFVSSLANLYDPTATVLTANLAYATHGVTTSVEALGSGDVSARNQSFPLKRLPLTYVPDSTGAGVQSTLTVRINSNAGVPAPAPSLNHPLSVTPRAATGELWKQVPSFFGVAPGAKAYTLSTDGRGAVSVNFGDGIEGARPPSGTDNIVAQYRTGLGPEGNLSAGSLVVFRKRPLGVQAVSNPIPATGGSNPETIESIRTRLNFSTRALGRIVSLRDYTDFCLSTDLVTKAHTIVLATDAVSRLIHITVALRGGIAVEQSPRACSSLTGAIAKARASRDPFHIAGFTPVFFRIQATVLADPTGLPEDFTATIRKALLTAFSLDLRLFGQDVTAAEIISTIQGVPGVRAVMLNALYLRDLPPSHAHRLTAQPARWSATNKKTLLAEILLLDPGYLDDMDTSLIVTFGPSL